MDEPQNQAGQQGKANVERQTGGIAAGMYIGEMHVHHAPSVPVSWHGRLSRNVPKRNTFFTGREDELLRLHSLLHTGNAALTPVPQALQGLGGIGKTSTACEYVYRFRQEYMGMFWVSGETPEQFAAQLAALVDELFAPADVPTEQDAALKQVHTWFATQEGWLLIVDNAEQLPRLVPLLPPLTTGRLLLTTREKATGSLAQRVEIERLDEDTGALLLLRRANHLRTDQTLDAAKPEWQKGAKTISTEVDGLPLALDQAGAYIESRSVTPTQYLAFYQKRRQTLHTDYQNPHHASVAVTFSLALEQVQNIPERGTAAVELAQLCAFLAPDAIPDAVFLTDPDELPDALAIYATDEIAFADVCEAATRYALLRRTTDPSGLTMHRLAQEVLRDLLSTEKRKQVTEQAMQAVSAAFPPPEFPDWPLCACLLPHAVACVQHFQEYELHTLQFAGMLNRAGVYLQLLVRYKEAEAFFVHSHSIYNNLRDKGYAYITAPLNNMGLLYREMGRYEEAASCLEQSVDMARTVLGEEDVQYANTIDNLAGVYYYQHRYAEAAALMKQALDITRRVLGLKNPVIALRLNSLANVYTDMGYYMEAEVLLKDALTISRETIGQDHPDYAACLLNLARLYILAGDVSKSAPLLVKALSISEQAHNPQHPDIAECCYWQGHMYYAQGNLTTAADCFQNAWKICECALGILHSKTVAVRSWRDRVERELVEKGR